MQIKQIIPAPGYFAVYDDNEQILKVELIAFCLVTSEDDLGCVLGYDETCSGSFCEDDPMFLGYETPNGPPVNWSQIIEERHKPLDDTI